MGLFDILSGIADFVSDSVEKEKDKQAKRGSAISSGRMKSTDKIKGSDSPIPAKPGLYRHKNKETGEIDYVGQTDNLRKRQQEHARAGKLDTNTQSVEFSEAKSDADKDDLCSTEVSHIIRHKPKGNTTKGGNGRR
jgi:hypothetical protein